LSEVDGVTTVTITTAFRDKVGRAHMARALQTAAQNGNNNGQDASFDAMEDLLTSLIDNGASS
jgi:hypothetical protein